MRRFSARRRYLTVPEAIHDRIKAMANMLGFCPGSTEADLGLRGLRTLAVRLERHQAQARVLIDWFRARPEVARVLYPGLEDDPGHAICGGISAAPAACSASYFGTIRQRRSRP